MQLHESHQLCTAHINKFVKVTMKDGKGHKGYIVGFEGDHVILAAPHETDESSYQIAADSRQYRFFPFFWIGLPLAFIAGVAARRPYRYPCPTYPCSAYPYPPYYPYGYPGYGY
ncbi:MAG TPA: hypothetical protein VJ824_14565 [Bacillota bacterium]|nr:hypothetical protein [Bacillota bacterium]